MRLTRAAVALTSSPVSGCLKTIHSGMPATALKITAHSGMFSQNQEPISRSSLRAGGVCCRLSHAGRLPVDFLSQL